MSEVLVEMLEDEQHNVKAEVLQGLAALKHPALWAAAVDALQFPDLYLLRTAVDLLRGVPRPAAIREPVFEVFERVSKEATDTSRRTRLAMVERLGEAIEPEQPDVQVWINKLRPYLNDYDPEVARAIAGVIEAISGYPERPRPTRRPGAQPNRAQLMAIPPCITITVDGQDWPILMDRGIAPIAIARLVSAINSGYYNNTVLHRVDENLAIFGNPGAHDEGGLPRFIRDEVGARHDDPHLVLMGHDRDEADGRLAIRYRDNPARFRRETVLGRVLPRTPGSADQAVVRFNSVIEGATVTRVWVGAPEPERRLWCPREVGIPPLRGGTTTGR
jgi:cyclophilin family peptidyl-prolyl cis-trans isomerase